MVLEVSLIDSFSISRSSCFDGYDSSDAKTYCDAINGMELKENSWVSAQIITENKQYSLDDFARMDFDIILKLEDLGVQKTLREIDSLELAMAMKGASETINEKIYRNMSERAAKMLKEDIECMGNVRISDVKEKQEKIVSIIRHLEDVGELIINHSEGEMLV